MTKTAAKQQKAAGAAGSAPSAAPKRAKLAAFLVTGDVDLWPQIGAHLPAKTNFRQLDSVGELLSEVPSDAPAVVLWDARGCAEKAAELSRIQSHSARFAMLVLDDDDSSWASAIQHGQIVAFVPVPVDQSRLIGALGSAYEEVNARVALLGEQSAPPGRAGGGKGIPRMTITGTVVVAAAIAAALLLSRHGGGDQSPVKPQSAASSAVAPAAAPAASQSEDKVDTLIGQAQAAMRGRHFIEPPEGSALSLYRSALVLDPSSGEARQGLQRLAEVLLARVQSALDERQFDAALQALETVRSIDPGDKRLPAFDERIAKMRAELGPAEILAAINAQNFDRAAQLIDQAARTKSASEPKLNQLREDLRRHRADSDSARLVALVDARLQQDQLVDPPNDSAVYYLSQARKAGATASELQSQLRELSRRLMLAARADIARQQLDDADRLATELHSIGAPLSQVAGLQHDIGLARAQRAPGAVPEQPRFLDLARARLAQGSVVEPENDSALHYLNELKAADPQNASLAPLSKAVQMQIVAQARAALDASQNGQADSLLQLAASLGPSPEADALRDRLRNAAARPATAGPREVAEASLTRTRTLDIEYPSSALSKKIEGRVEVGYVVTPKGVVSDLKVLEAAPPGVFDRAAANAVSRLRYKPVMDAGKPVAVSTKVLVIFRLAK
ncbi:MAG TPA: TonB family protein [Steroidobacteraceae bacterium]